MFTIRLRSRVLPILLALIGSGLLIFMRVNNLDRLYLLAGLGVIAVLSVGLWRLHLRVMTRDMPWISDSDFIDRARAMVDIPDQLLLSGRDWIASHFGIAPQRLAPEERLVDLAERLDFWGNALVGLGDIEFELQEASQSPGKDLPSLNELTVVGTIETLIRLDVGRALSKNST